MEPGIGDESSNGCALRHGLVVENIGGGGNGLVVTAPGVGEWGACLRNYSDLPTMEVVA